jgi:PAS domain S-box-containing protein
MALDITARKRAEAEARRTHEELRRAHEELYQAHGELRRVLDSLEERVRERTAELNLANEQLQREVAERLRAEESLQRSVDLYRLLADHSTDVISRLSPDGVHVYVSPASLAITGFAPEEIVGRSIFDLAHQDDVDMLRGVQQQVLSTADTVTTTFRIRRKDHGYAWIESTCKRLSDPAGGVEGIIAVTRDVSERKEAAERLTRLQDELAHVARVSSLGEMASGLAHELNQPLTAVINYLEASRRLLSESKVAPEVTAAINEAAAEAQRAGRIIQRLRAFVRRGETERTVADVNRLVAEVMELAAADLRARRVKVELELGPDLPGVKADAVQVQQVILNLLWNAVEAMTNEGRGERRITIRTVRSGEREVEVGVSDTGPGLAPEVRERLFEPFYTTKESGLGLGLPISYSIVEAHGGRLWADPETAAGTTFRFTLPVAVVPAGA